MKRKIYKLISSAKQSLFVLALLVSGTAHSQISYTLTFTGAAQALPLTAGVWGVECWGANGGDVTAGPGGGGKGGYSKGEFNLSGAGIINVLVGGRGVNATGSSAVAGAGGWNGGGGGAAVGRSGGGGGGATDVRVGGIGAANRIIVAGGGGGAAYYSTSPFVAAGGNGGGVGQNGDIITSAGLLTPGGGGAGAIGGSPGLASVGTANGDVNGGGGGGSSAGASIGQPGVGGGPGGAAGPSSGGSTGSAGGGGGGFAGGAGGVQTTNAGVAGGGGSGYIGGVTNGTTIAFGQPGFVPNPDVNGDGYIVIRELCNIGLNATKNPICLGESITLSTGALGGILWAHNGSTASQVNVSPTTNTTYTVSGQGANSCTTSVALTVTVNPLPVLSAVVIPSVLCVGKTATIIPSGGVNYTWTASSQVGLTTTVNPAVTSSFNYSGENMYGCISSTQVAVTVNTNSLDITPNSAVCAGNSIVLTANNAVTYTWSTGNNFQSTPVTPVTNTTYMASGTDIHNCVISNQVNVTVEQKPNVTASAGKSTICKGESTTLNASGATTYTWSGSLGTNQQVSINPLIDVAYSYTVTGTSANGCTNTAVVVVAVSKCTGLSKTGGEVFNSKIYPNPTSGEVTVELNNGLTNSIEVTDLTGRVIMNVDTKEEVVNLNLNKLSNGVYYFKIKSAEQTEIIKVVKSN